MRTTLWRFRVDLSNRACDNAVPAPNVVQIPVQRCGDCCASGHERQRFEGGGPAMFVGDRANTVA